MGLYDLFVSGLGAADPGAGLWVGLFALLILGVGSFLVGIGVNSMDDKESDHE